MTRKNWLLLGFALALGGISLYLNSDWFGSEDIQIVHRTVQQQMTPQRRKQPQPGQPKVVPILFNFDRKLQLTEVKVVKVSELETNKYAHPTWHLVSDSNSLPTMGIVYGARVPGMRPAIKEATPDPCEPGVKYRLLVTAGGKTAQHDFTVTSVPK